VHALQTAALVNVFSRRGKKSRVSDPNACVAAAATKECYHTDRFWLAASTLERFSFFIDAGSW
jgi:hypothetical protein